MTDEYAAGLEALKKELPKWGWGHDDDKISELLTTISVRAGEIVLDEISNQLREDTAEIRMRENGEVYLTKTGWDGCFYVEMSLTKAIVEENLEFGWAEKEDRNALAAALRVLADQVDLITSEDEIANLNGGA